MRALLIPLTFAVLTSALNAGDWPQGAGTSGDFSTSEPAPLSWSVVRDENITWKITLPESGQSPAVIVGDRLFFSTNKEVTADTPRGSDIVAWCVNAKTGEILWQRPIAGKYPLRLSGCFSDSTSPPAVCDGERVVFINTSGTIACFDLDGGPLWTKEILTAGRTLPFLVDDLLVFTRQIYPPNPDGNFPHTYADSPVAMWTQLQALNLADGEVAWTTTCGVNMGCHILPEVLSDGRKVAIVGRGGGHGPPEKPDGISLIDLNDGSTDWSLPLEGFMATMSFRVRNDQVHLFDGGEHLSVDVSNGRIVNRVSILDDVSVRRQIDGKRVTKTESIPDAKKGRMITQGSNLLVGLWHYFRSYTRPYLGRVNVDNGKVEYLELPLQLGRESATKTDEFLWFVEPIGKKGPGIHQQTIVPNEVKNSRGFVVMGDKRSAGSGWGHIASASPSVAGDHLYVPVMNGTVYVLKWDAPVLDEDAVVAINDLGPAGSAWTRASLSFAHGHAYAHTIRELICIGGTFP
ncbi:MAG: PQQ-binding-like beta-propeller repeat protein [Verrucomicrobiae bacterium]|nr:PQQ-binding-like beta-propeller repeat protein [Verrucomicrobiae bacterium]